MATALQTTLSDLSATLASLEAQVHAKRHGFRSDVPFSVLSKAEKRAFCEYMDATDDLRDLRNQAKRQASLADAMNRPKPLIDGRFIMADGSIDFHNEPADGVCWTDEFAAVNRTNFGG